MTPLPGQGDERTDTTICFPCHKQQVYDTRMAYNLLRLHGKISHDLSLGAFTVIWNATLEQARASARHFGVELKNPGHRGRENPGK